MLTSRFQRLISLYNKLKAAHSKSDITEKRWAAQPAGTAKAKQVLRAPPQPLGGTSSPLQ